MPSGTWSAFSGGSASSSLVVALSWVGSASAMTVASSVWADEASMISCCASVSPDAGAPGSGVSTGRQES